MRTEFQRITASTMGKLALVALMAVPLLYGGLYLWANRDPQAGMANVPAAIVVEDAGAIASDGAYRNAGSDVAQQLIDDAAFRWARVDRAAAMTGINEGTYTFAIIVPESFSASLQSVGGQQPVAAHLQLVTNDATNYLGTTSGQRVAEALRAAVTTKVGQEASASMLLAISDIRANLQSAADVAAQLATGATDAHTGSVSLRDGAQKLDEGAAKLDAGAAELAGGAGKLTTGLDTLASSTASLPSQTQQLADGAAKVAAGNAQLAGVANDVGTVSSTLAGDLPRLRTEFAQRLRDRGVDEATIQLTLQQLAPLEGAVTDANTSVQGKVAQLGALASGAQQLSDGASKLAAAAPQLTAGIQQAQAGAGQLSTGATQLSSGATALHTGTGDLATGTTKLETGLGELASGTGKLRDALASGVAKIPVSTPELREAQSTTIASPVAVEQQAVTKAGNYGEGLAPLFMTLAAWIGIYALFLIVRPYSARAVTAMRNPVRVALAGWLTPATLGGLQMLALFGILHLWVGISAAHPWLVLGWMLLSSATFAAIIMVLNVWLGAVGQFLGLVLMVLQLVTSGGTFPWQTLPEPLQWLHHALPMSWAVDGMRHLLYGGDLAPVLPKLSLLITVCLAALALAMLGVARLTEGRIMRDLQPSVIG